MGPAGKFILSMCCYDSASKHGVFQRRVAKAQGLEEQRSRNKGAGSYILCHQPSTYY